jgi:hypothetical protein
MCGVPGDVCGVKALRHCYRLIAYLIDKASSLVLLSLLRVASAPSAVRSRNSGYSLTAYKCRTFYLQRFFTLPGLSTAGCYNHML